MDSRLLFQDWQIKKSAAIDIIDLWVFERDRLEAAHISDSASSQSLERVRSENQFFDILELGKKCWRHFSEVCTVQDQDFGTLVDSARIQVSWSLFYYI